VCFKILLAETFCLHHGILPLLSKIVTTFPTIQDEACTTLAAVCLGNDRNALFATMEFESWVDKSFPTAASGTRLHPTLGYLQALFRVVHREQRVLLEHFQGHEISETILAADAAYQSTLQEPQPLQTNHQWTRAERTLSKAIQQAQKLATHTNLLDDFLQTCFEQRSVFRLKLEDWNGVLQDRDRCSTKQTALFVTRQADAYVGRHQWSKALKRRWMTPSNVSRTARTATRGSTNETRFNSKDWSKSQPGWMEEEAEIAVRPGAWVHCLYGTGVVQEVRKCGTTKIQLHSWWPGTQAVGLS
jgi:hypothetical protein